MDSPQWPEPCQERPRWASFHTLDRSHPGGVNPASCLAQKIIIVEVVDQLLFAS